MIGISLLGCLTGISLAQSASAAAFPPVRVHDEPVRYAVTGQSAETINAQLRKYALSLGQTEQGNTRSEIELNSTLEPTAGACRIAALTVDLHVTTTLPEWTPLAPPKAELRQRVLDGLERLRRHEAGHRENAVIAAEALRAAVLALAPRTSCTRLQAAIDAQFQKAQWRLEFQEESYDARTRYGERDDPRRLRREASSTQVSQ